jgi:hypothetical protein
LIAQAARRNRLGKRILNALFLPMDYTVKPSGDFRIDREAILRATDVAEGKTFFH